MDEYVIDKIISSGASLRVYRATTPDGTFVALKFLQKDYIFNDNALDQVDMEEEVLRTVIHPGLPKHLGRGMHRGIPYLVQEYISHRSLERFAPFSAGYYPTLFVARAMYAVCDVLSALHERGITQRDIKPNNVLVAGHHGARRFVLIDFGSAQFVGRTRGKGARIGTLAGTPMFMAPEIARQECATAESDIFNVGATIHQLCIDREGPYGVNPDTLATPEMLDYILGLVRCGKVRPPRFSVYPNGLQEVVIKATHPDPAQRYPSAQALKEALYPFTLKYPT